MYCVCLAKLGYAIAAATALLGACVFVQAENRAPQLLFRHTSTQTLRPSATALDISEVGTRGIRLYRR